jgi:hypothetical protein
MRENGWIGIVSFLLLTLLIGILHIAGCGEEADDTRLSGSAEDLWGARVDFDTCMEGVTVISPFSPAT